MDPKADGKVQGSVPEVWTRLYRYATERIKNNRFYSLHLDISVNPGRASIEEAKGVVEQGCQIYRYAAKSKWKNKMRKGIIRCH